MSGLTQDADAVELTLLRWEDYRETGQEQRVRARYVIAATAARAASGTCWASSGTTSASTSAG